MAPKTPTAAKTASLLHHIRSSSTAHTLKELEKSAPGPTGISSMQLKDHLQALVDENQVRVEKIGSGNWYWSFMSEETRVRKESLAKLRAERDTLEARIEGLRMKVRSAEVGEDERREREEATETFDQLNGEVQALSEEIKGYAGKDPEAVEELRKEGFKAKESAERWTDNVLLLESWFLELTSGDQDQLESMRRVVYGAEYAEGEGLMEW